jgi:hypothetical protein
VVLELLVKVTTVVAVHLTLTLIAQAVEEVEQVLLVQLLQMLMVVQAVQVVLHP